MRFSGGNGMRHAWLTVALGLLIPATSPVYAGSVGFVYGNGTYAAIEAPGSVETRVFGINNSGQTVGYSFGGTTAQGFVYSNGNFSTISPPGSKSSGAVAINDLGQIIGSFSNGAPQSASFLYSNGNYTTLQPPGSTQSAPLGINASGQVVGYAYFGGPYSLGYAYTGGSYCRADQFTGIRANSAVLANLKAGRAVRLRSRARSRAVQGKSPKIQGGLSMDDLHHELE